MNSQVMGDSSSDEDSKDKEVGKLLFFTIIISLHCPVFRWKSSIHMMDEGFRKHATVLQGVNMERVIFCQ